MFLLHCVYFIRPFGMISPCSGFPGTSILVLLIFPASTASFFVNRPLLLKKVFFGKTETISSTICSSTSLSIEIGFLFEDFRKFLNESFFREFLSLKGNDHQNIQTLSMTNEKHSYILFLFFGP